MSTPSDQFDMKRWLQESVRNGAWLDAQDFSNVITAGELLEQRQCSPQCLLALNDEAGGCSCRCGGKYHGSLLNADLAAPAKPWWEQVNPWVRGALNQSKLIAQSTSQANRWANEAFRKGEDAFFIAKIAKSQWRVEHDGYAMGNKNYWGELESRLLNRLVHRLLQHRRIEGASGFPSSYAIFYGIRDAEEACVIWTILGECKVGNVSTVVRAIEVLEGRPDPVALDLHPEKGYPEKLAYEDNPADQWKQAA